MSDREAGSSTSERHCGCAWRIIPASEIPPHIRQGVLPVARFIRRCTEHELMCRMLEDWEINLLRQPEIR